MEKEKISFCRKLVIEVLTMLLNERYNYFRYKQGILKEKLLKREAII